MVASKKSYDFDGLFTAMTVNELYDVNGGMQDNNCGGGVSEKKEKTKKENKINSTDVKYIIARVIAEIFTVGNNDASTKEGIARGLSGKRD